MDIWADRYKRINGHTLKLIACAVMLIDHITAGILLQVIRAGLYPDSVSFDTMKLIYMILRGIGRNSFPIFCFLLVEGFIHTKSRLRYALSLLIFGFISEPFFDAVFYAKEEVFNLNIVECLKANPDHLAEHCNVYFTLLIGLLVIWASEKAMDFVRQFNWPMEVRYLVSAPFLLLGIWVAETFHTDYHGYGVGLIFAFYIFRDLCPINLIVGYVVLSLLGTEGYSLPCFVLLYFYNHKRGRRIGNLKYLFYAFYPFHIAFIYFIRCILFG